MTVLHLTAFAFNCSRCSYYDVTAASVSDATRASAATRCRLLLSENADEWKRANLT